MRSCCRGDPGLELLWWSPPPTRLVKASTQWRHGSSPLHHVHRLNLTVSTRRFSVKCRTRRNILCPLPMQIEGFTQYCILAAALWCTCRLLYRFVQVQSPEAADRVRGGVCPAGSRGCRAPVIHMVIVRGPARAQPYISSPVSLTGSRWQPGEERREERRKGGDHCLFVCLPAFVLFRGFCWSQ